MRLKLVGLLAVLMMIVASCGGAVPEAAGPSEGIQVHGDWTIDIYNEDWFAGSSSGVQQCVDFLGCGGSSRDHVRTGDRRSVDN